MQYRLKIYSIQEFGQRKDAEGNPHQEDSIYPAYGEQKDSDRTFILCDGMGGHDAGEVASATVCEAMSGSIANDGHDAEGIFTETDFAAALSAAFEALDAKDNGAAKKMGTTMTFLKLHNQGAFIAHMGDSRVYQIRPGKNGEDTKIVFETEDHSLVNDLVKIGELTREEARHSPQKNVITRAMQPHMERRPKADIHTTTDVRSGDYFYLCSDGMLEESDMESGESLRNIFSEAGGDDERKVKILTEVTKRNRDNHTAIIVHVLKVIDPIASEPSTESEGVVVMEKGAPAKSATPGTPAEDFAIVEDEATVPNAASAPRPLPRIKPEKGTEAIHPKFKVLRFVIAALMVALVVVSIALIRTCRADKEDAEEVATEVQEELASPREVRQAPQRPKNAAPAATESPADTVAPQVATAPAAEAKPSAETPVFDPRKLKLPEQPEEPAQPEELGEVSEV